MVNIICKKTKQYVGKRKSGLCTPGSVIKRRYKGVNLPIYISELTMTMLFRLWYHHYGQNESESAYMKARRTGHCILCLLCGVQLGH